MLRETIATGIKMGPIRKAQLKPINLDTTVQTKVVCYPKDARLYHCWRERRALRRDARACWSRKVADMWASGCC